MTDESRQARRVVLNPGSTYKRRRFWLVVIIVIIILIVIGSRHSSSGGGSDIKVRATNVLALNGNTVRVYLKFTNSGDSSGSASCVMNTTVYNQFGDEVNVRVNATGTNTVGPNQSKVLYQDIGVDNGDAQYVKATDVKLVDC